MFDISFQNTKIYTFKTFSLILNILLIFYIIFYHLTKKSRFNFYLIVFNIIKLSINIGIPCLFVSKVFEDSSLNNLLLCYFILFLFISLLSYLKFKQTNDKIILYMLIEIIVFNLFFNDLQNFFVINFMILNVLMDVLNLSTVLFDWISSKRKKRPSFTEFYGSDNTPDEVDGSSFRTKRLVEDTTKIDRINLNTQRLSEDTTISFDSMKSNNVFHHRIPGFLELYVNGDRVNHENNDEEEKTINNQTYQISVEIKPKSKFGIRPITFQRTNFYENKNSEILFQSNECSVDENLINNTNINCNSENLDTLVESNENTEIIYEDIDTFDIKFSKSQFSKPNKHVILYEPENLQENDNNILGDTYLDNRISFYDKYNLKTPDNSNESIRIINEINDNLDISSEPIYITMDSFNKSKYQKENESQNCLLEKDSEKNFIKTNID